MGGAIANPPTPTAFAHREAAFDLLVESTWADPTDDAAHFAWADEVIADPAIAAEATGGRYVNYLQDAGEAEIRAAYGNGSRFDELRVRHILFTVANATEEAAKKKKAEDTLAQLRDGADFIALAKKVSEDTASKPSGGDLGTVTRSTPFDQTFLNAAFRLKKGQISGLVRTQFGFHIIRVDDRTSKTLDQARAELTQEIADSKRQDAFTEFMKGRVDAARIVVNPRYGDFNPATLSIDAHDFFVPPQPAPETQSFPSR
jgi:hypothetical protein